MQPVCDTWLRGSVFWVVHMQAQAEGGNMPEGIRINKFLSEAGVCSRREADRQIEAGAVAIDGQRAQTGSRVLPGQEVFFMGKRVQKEERQIGRASCRERVWYLV